MQTPQIQSKSVDVILDNNYEIESDSLDYMNENTAQFEPQEHQFEPTKKESSLFALKNSHIKKSTSRKPTIQPKLIIGAPNDKYEQEADRMADLVVRQISTGKIQPQKKKKEKRNAFCAAKMPKLSGFLLRF